MSEIENEKESNTSETVVASVSDVVIQYTVFSVWRKRCIVGLVTMAAWFSTLSSFIYYPAIPLISEDLRLSITDVNLSIATYMAASAIVPSITGAASDIYGRRPMYLFTITLYLAANIGIALQYSFAGLLILRILQSTGISGSFSIAYGVVADIAMPSERGVYVAALTFGITAAPSVGPIIGGALSHGFGWRSIFWFLCIMAAICLTAMTLFLPETARGVVGNGSLKPPRLARLPSSQCSAQNGSDATQQGFAPKNRRKFPNLLVSLKMLLEKDNAVVAFSGAFLYVTFCCIPASLGTLFVKLYGLNQLQAGLVYFPFGIGCTLAAVASGKIIDHDYRKTAEKYGLPIDKVRGDDLLPFPIEEARLRSVLAPLVTSVVSVVAFGWVLDRRLHLSIPLILQFISGISIQLCFNTTNTLRVDINPKAPAAAQASSNFVRCTLAGVCIAFLDSLINRIGVGWTYSFLGSLCSISGVLFVVERQMGMKWRQSRLGYTRHNI